ncbi:MAG: ATP-binding protein [Cyanobacteria bacterium SIG29]|nr:ATP-binding protein [Cyanobacteria bacterium SIG29]
MKISSNFYNRNLSFGYDKQLNAELKERLAQHPDKQWAKDLSSMNTLANRLESRVSNYAKYSDVENNTKYQDYLDMFLSLKQVLAGFISITFTDLDFANREFNHYYDEFVKAGSPKDDWKMDACASLEDWIDTEHSSKLVKNTPSPKQELYKPQFNEDGVEISQQPEQKPQQKPESSPSAPSPAVQSILNKITDKSMLEEFIPTPSSPKGFDDVAGMFSLKRDLTEGIIQFIQDPQQAQLDFEEYGKTIPKGILLYGPPGCGKTYITQALAEQTKSPLYLLNISKAGSHYINMTSKNIKAAFDEIIAIADKSDRPTLLFMDEIDTMAFDRSSRMEPDDLKQVGTILQGIDLAKSHNVIILGATNKYNLLDPAVKRRFDSKVFVDIPDQESRVAVLEMNLKPLKKAQKLLQSPEDLEKIAKMLNGYSNSSICTISKQAALNAMRRGRADIAVEDYEIAIKNSGEEKPDRKDYLADYKKTTNKIGFN